MMKKVFPIYLLNFLLAVSTTIGMTLIPLLATEKLGMSLLILGMIEGGAELVSNLLRLITGNLFDRIKNRRVLFIFPTVLALISKILLYYPTAVTILVSKITERISNGAFAAPRDAFVGENVKNKGMALGWLSVTKTLGCVIGPVFISVYTLLIGSLAENILKIILLACLINFAGLIVAFFIKANKFKQKGEEKDKFDFKKMKLIFKILLPLFTLSFIFFLGRFNDGLILIYLKTQGFPEWYYLATISFFNIVMLIVSPFIGYWIDRGKDKYILLITASALIAFNIFFAQITNISWVFACLGLIMWGVQRAGAQVTFTAIIFKTIPVAYYGSAIGAYSVISGLGTLISSLICGYLAQKHFNYIFIFSGFFSTCALILAFIYNKKIKA